MNRKYLVLLVLLIILFVCFAPALGENPFMSGTAVEKTKQGLHYPAFVRRFIQKIGALQRKMNKRMTALGREIKTGENPHAIFILIALAFAYGVIHAIGPGHGKTVSGSYFLSRRATMKKGILLGFLIAVIHAVSAVTVVLVLYFILKKGIGTSMEHYSRAVKIASAGAIMLIGAFLLVRRVIRKNGEEEERENHDSHDRSLLLIAFAVGIVPCPGAVLILLFSMNMDIILYGIILAFVMSVGMALTISVTCCAVIVAKKGILGSWGDGGSGIKRDARRIGLYSVEILGAVIVVLFGVFLLAGTL
jgi:nickel/cobalt exporter